MNHQLFPNSMSSTTIAMPEQQQQRTIATSGAALQTFSALFSSQSRDVLDSSDRIVKNKPARIGRKPTRRPPVSSSRSSSSSPVSTSTCRESYRLFKKCSAARETEGFSCSDAVASYMRCALSDGC
mmetsp:Transcript_3240/g.8265  ORF Transcript_3240/g.8265 Transcript_3240/m.8265 type:complete len:126 (+) Transcript_3240:72-449(+)